MATELKIHRAQKYGTPTVSVTAALLRESGLSSSTHVEAEVVGDTIVLRKAGKPYATSEKPDQG